MPPVFQRFVALAAALVLSFAGCTSVSDYLHNGFKVGPNYCPPSVPVAPRWIDASDARVHSQMEDLSAWWQVLDDPLLNDLETAAYRQNLTLRQAGMQILEARAQLGIAVGGFFPQTQTATGSYRRFGVGKNFFDQWNFGFNLIWEVDFWGRLRRAIASAEDTLDASAFNYDEVLVTLMGDVANDYVLIRTFQERIRLLDRLVRVQRDVYNFIDERLKLGRAGITTLDKAQAESNLKASMAQLNELAIAQRQTENALCTLLGMPPENLRRMLDTAPKTTVPITPENIVAGIPADVLRQRPDVRRAERLAAAQAEQIGIAESALYPIFTINGTLGWQASHFGDLFTPQALNGVVGPSFQWNLLNYGRLMNNVRLQDARFQELAAAYQATVIQADLEVENGIVQFLQAQARIKSLKESVDASNVALLVIVGQYEVGLAGVDFNRYAVILQTLITQQDQWVQARGEVAQGLIQVYRGLGGGWQIRLKPESGPLNPEIPGQHPLCGAAGGAPANAPEGVPTPQPQRLPAAQQGPPKAAVELTPPRIPAM